MNENQRNRGEEEASFQRKLARKLASPFLWNLEKGEAGVHRDK
jgi:hypothetical protein